MPAPVHPVTGVSYDPPFASQGYLRYNRWLNEKAQMTGNIGKIVKEQRKSIPLTLHQLSEMSGVSVSHLSRIEQGLRKPSPRTLQRISRPLGFDLDELLTMAGFLSPKDPLFSEEQREKLRAELHTLLDRAVTDGKRIKEITDRLLMS